MSELHSAGLAQLPSAPPFSSASCPGISKHLTSITVLGRKATLSLFYRGGNGGPKKAQEPGGLLIPAARPSPQAQPKASSVPARAAGRAMSVLLAAQRRVVLCDTEGFALGWICALSLIILG